jgi:hypothetical protein
VIMFLLFIFPGSAGGEEIGWRGFPLPHLHPAEGALPPARSGSCSVPALEPGQGRPRRYRAGRNG